MNERRNIKRRYLMYFLRIFDKKQDRFIGNLVDITTDGIMVMSENPIETNTVFQLKMYLPEKIKGKEEISFDARSIRSNKETRPAFYFTGFQYQKVDPDDAEIIKNLIDNFGISEKSE